MSKVLKLRKLISQKCFRFKVKGQFADRVDCPLLYLSVYSDVPEPPFPVNKSHVSGENEPLLC